MANEVLTKRLFKGEALQQMALAAGVDEVDWSSAISIETYMTACRAMMYQMMFDVEILGVVGWVVSVPPRLR